MKRTDPQGYANVFRKVNWAYNSDKGKEILENSVLLNIDAQGKPIADQSGNLSYRLGPDGAKMTGKDDFDHAFRQYMGRQGTGLNLSASSPWGTYGKAAQANAASPMQNKGEAEAVKSIAEGNKAAVDPLFAAETKRVLPGIGDSGIQQFRATLNQYRNRVTDPQMVAATESLLKDQAADSPARKIWEAMKSDPRKMAIQDTARDLGITPNLESAPSTPKSSGTVFSPTSVAVTPVAAKPMVKDGDRVRDKNTGKYFIMRGGKLVPLE